MITLQLLHRYITWHYSRALLDMAHIFMNVLWFLTQLFSINMLARTLFARWRRLGEMHERTFDIADFLAVLFVNTVMRLFGFFARAMLLVVGLFSLLAAFLLGVAVFAVWFFLPVVLAAVFFLGFDLLFTSP